MDIYLFFKRFFVALGKAPAEWLNSHGIGANGASFLAAVLLVPLIVILALLNGTAFWGYFVALLLFKLVANAIDGIIARIRGDSSKLGMVLNVSTDLVPDIAISAITLSELGVPTGTIYVIAAIQCCYLVSELVFIALFGMQNLYFGKDLRTFFFALLGISAAVPFIL